MATKCKRKKRSTRVGTGAKAPTVGTRGYRRPDPDPEARDPGNLPAPARHPLYGPDGWSFVYLPSGETVRVEREYRGSPAEPLILTLVEGRLHYAVYLRQGWMTDPR